MKCEVEVKLIIIIIIIIMIIWHMIIKFLKRPSFLHGIAFVSKVSQCKQVTVVHTYYSSPVHSAV